ncbi:MAG: O-antigen ligase family protein [Phycisphaerales bacterium]
MGASENRIRTAGLLTLAMQCPAWCALFLFSLLLPTEFSVYAGGLRLSPYRIVLLLAFFPVAFRLFSGRCGRMIPPDWMVIGFGLWNMVVLGNHHGMAVMLESGGIQFLELTGAYLIARTTIRNMEQFVGVVLVLFAVIMMILPFTLVESATGTHVIKQFAATATGGGFSSRIDPRMGFTRSYGPFDHPILWGVFASSALGVVWMFYQVRRKMLEATGTLVVIVAALTSISSGALVAMWTQAFGAVYERYTRSLAARWKYFWIGVAISYVVLELASTRSVFIAITTRISLSSGTAYGRSIIFQYGIQNVWANPIFGIGFNEWERPSWLHTSVDNFWLLTAMTYGLPGFFLLAGAVLCMLLMKWSSCSGIAEQLRIGWTISMAGMIIAGCTVHFWNNVYVYFAFLLGCGAIFCTGVLKAEGASASGRGESAPPQAPKRFFQ